MEGVDLVARLLEVARPGVGEGGGADAFPLGAQRLDDGGQHQAFDVGAGREVGAQLVAFAGIQRPFQQRAEDGGLDAGSSSAWRLP